MLVVDGDGKVAGFEAVVLVVESLEPGALQRARRHLAELRPFVLRHAPNRDRAVGRRADRSRNRDRVPASGSTEAPAPIPNRLRPRGPLVVVSRGAPIGHHAVDRRAAAHHFGLLVAMDAAASSSSLRGRFLIEDPQIAPMMPGIEIGDDGIAVPDDLVRMTGRGVLSGFDQGDPKLRARRKTAGNDAASRPTANDDVIVGCAIAAGSLVERRFFRTLGAREAQRRAVPAEGFCFVTGNRQESRACSPDRPRRPLRSGSRARSGRRRVPWHR